MLLINLIIAMVCQMTLTSLWPPRFHESVRSRGLVIVSHGTRLVEYAPAIHGAGGGGIGAACPRSSA